MPFSCAYIELWMHLGSLESTQKGRVALGCASRNCLGTFVLSKLPPTSITRYTHAKHEQIPNLNIAIFNSVLIISIISGIMAVVMKCGGQQEA